MTVTFKPLRSQHGFESPGFSVSPTGQLSIASGAPLEFNDRVDIDDALYVTDQIYLRNLPLLDFSTPMVNKLGPAITESFLTKLATLQNLSVAGNITIRDASNNLNVGITSGVISINSTSLGNLDNIAIGQTTSANANFNNVNIGSIGNSATLTVTGTMAVSSSANIPTITNTVLTNTTINTVTVTSTTENTTTLNATNINSDALTADDITINNTPVESYHATRKDYVDSRISAFSIAFGA